MAVTTITTVVVIMTVMYNIVNEKDDASDYNNDENENNNKNIAIWDRSNTKENQSKQMRRRLLWYCAFCLVVLLVYYCIIYCGCDLFAFYTNFANFAIFANILWGFCFAIFANISRLWHRKPTNGEPVAVDQLFFAYFFINFTYSDITARTLSMQCTFYIIYITLPNIIGE